MNNTLNYDYGGWLAESTKSTGPSSPLVRWVGWFAAASTVIAGIGTGGVLSQRALSHPELHASSLNAAVESQPSRTPIENLKHIREVLKPAVSDLATAFGVSRQSVYNWLNGEPVADENAAKLQDLADASDVLVSEGLTINSALMKRKISNGRTLMQVAASGESVTNAARSLAQIYKRESIQREQLNARFANRTKKPASADFDFTASNDQA
ncbi:hypothetical protein [Comamonas odontotermitis]|uniref:hypothetical protein n=1 Tax=Comamonas odontotermitis TaxID=379895 RepID=UPI003750E180